MITSAADRSSYFITSPRAYANNETYFNPNCRVYVRMYKERRKSEHYKIESPSFREEEIEGTFRSAKSKLQREISVVSRSRRRLVIVVETTSRNPSGDNEINFRGIRNRATIRSLEVPFCWLV